MRGAPVVGGQVQGIQRPGPPAASYVFVPSSAQPAGFWSCCLPPGIEANPSAYPRVPSSDETHSTASQSKLPVPKICPKRAFGEPVIRRRGAVPARLLAPRPRPALSAIRHWCTLAGYNRGTYPGGASTADESESYSWRSARFKRRTIRV